jgi:hypothetical protein
VRCETCQLYDCKECKYEPEYLNAVEIWDKGVKIYDSEDREKGSQTGIP